MKVRRSLLGGKLLKAVCEYCGYETNLAKTTPQSVRANRCPMCYKTSKPVDKIAEWRHY